MEEKFNKVITFPGVKPDAYVINPNGVIFDCNETSILNSNDRYTMLESTDGDTRYFDIKSLLYWEFVEHYDMKVFYISYHVYDIGVELSNLTKRPLRIDPNSPALGDHAIRDLCKALVKNKMKKMPSLREFPIVSQAYISGIANSKYRTEISNLYFDKRVFNNLKYVEENDFNSIRTNIDMNLINELNLRTPQFFYNKDTMIFEYHNCLYNISTNIIDDIPTIILQNDKDMLLIIKQCNDPFIASYDNGSAFSILRYCDDNDFIYDIIKQTFSMVETGYVDISSVKLTESVQSVIDEKNTSAKQIWSKFNM